jgi:uncharacterized protein (DUF2336 family)
MPVISAELALIKEVDSAIAGASSSRRSEMLRKVTDLFVKGSEEYSGEDISVFDDVITRLAAEIEQSARVLLAKRLAPIRNSPPQIIRVLAFDDAIDVAGPVLTQSERLDDKTLVEIARTKGQAHMLAISQRASLNELVTDVLVELGDRQVVLNAVDNFGAAISDVAFSALVRRSEGDDALAEFVGSRPEIPSPLLASLVAKASQAVRAKLEASHPRAKAEVQRAVAEAAGRVEARMTTALFDYTSALKSIDNLQRSGNLGERALSDFARNGDYAEVTAALAVLGDLPLQFVERAMTRDRSETLVVLAKAVGLSWSTVNDILLLRAKKGFLAQSEIQHRLARFDRLQSSTAQEIMRLHRTRAVQTNGSAAGALAR